MVVIEHTNKNHRPAGQFSHASNFGPTEDTGGLPNLETFIENLLSPILNDALQ